MVDDVKRDVGTDLFLDQAAVACEPIPQAALAVYAYIFAPPALQPELDNLEVNRRGVHYPVATTSAPARTQHAPTNVDSARTRGAIRRA